jgi:hypothetical protein
MTPKPRADAPTVLVQAIRRPWTIENGLRVLMCVPAWPGFFIHEGAKGWPSTLTPRRPQAAASMQQGQSAHDVYKQTLKERPSALARGAVNPYLTIVI